MKPSGGEASATTVTCRRDVTCYVLPAAHPRPAAEILPAETLQATPLRRASLAIEIGDALRYPALFFFGEFGEHGQGQDFFRGAFGFREVAFAVSQIGETGLQVERDGVVDFGADFAGGEELAQVVAAESADYVLVENVLRAR